MNFMHSIRADLLEKRLLPVVAVLAALVVLVPVGAGVLKGSGSAGPAIAPAPLPTPPPGAPAPGAALQAVAGPGTPKALRYTGRELDPFRPRAGASAATSPLGPTGNVTPANVTPAAAVRVKVAPVAAPTTPVKVKAPRTKPTPTAPVPATTVPAPTPVPVATPSPKAQLARLGLRDSYSVDINVADSTGTRHQASVVRLSPLPSSTNPLVEYLGVLKSGRAASFLVNPGTVPQGPGRCLPRASDCQVLILKPGQLEALSVRSSGAPIVQAQIAVANWRVVTHSSVAAAREVRAREVEQGRALVTEAAQPALSDLVYTVAQGAVSVIPAIFHALPGVLAKLLGG